MRSWSVIKRHVPLYVMIHFFDYLGSIINYAAVGGAILYLSKAEGMGEAEIAALVARGSYSCLYLIDAFYQVDTGVLFLRGRGWLLMPSASLPCFAVVATSVPRNTKSTRKHRTTAKAATQSTTTTTTTGSLHNTICNA